MPAKLSITTDPSPLVVEVRDAEYRRRDLGLSPRELNTIEKGPYIVSATMADGRIIHRAITITEDTNYRINLTADDSETHRASAALYTRLWNVFRQWTEPQVEEIAVEGSVSSNEPDAFARLRQANPTTDPSDTVRLPIGVRLFSLEDWGTARPIAIPQISGVYDGPEARIDLYLKGRRVLLAQITAPDLIPVNVAVPAAGRFTSTKCSLRVRTGLEQIAVRVQFQNPAVNLCARYLERGDFERAHQLAAQSMPRSSTVLKTLSQKLALRFNDPTAAVLGRYLGLRVGELDWSHNLLESFVDVFDWMSDGLIISGELAARLGSHQRALALMLSASDLRQHALPLFTDGYRLLVSRLQQYSREKGRLSVIPEEESKRARQALERLDDYTPHIEIDPITLTFMGSDLSNLAGSQTSVSMDSPEWFRLSPETAQRSSKSPDALKAGGYESNPTRTVVTNSSGSTEQGGGMSQEQRKSACQFDQVYKDELRYVYQRRRKLNTESGEATDQDLENTKQDLIGLALSGGGIRSATTCLGMLQAFSAMGILPMVDYLSTVSGGGYIGSCLSALLSVNKDSVQAAGRPEQYRFNRREDSLFTSEWENFPFRAEGNEGRYGRLTGETEVKHLRTHGNFLMARQGLFARETMRSVGNLLTGIAYHLLIVLLFLFSLSALYMATLVLLAPGIEQLLEQSPAKTTTATETRVETTSQPANATTIFTEKRTVSQDPTLWEQLWQKSQILRDFVSQLKKKYWPFALALMLGVGLSLVAFLRMWKVMADYQARPPTKRAQPEPGDSAEDHFERGLLKRVGLVSVAVAVVGVIVIRWAFARTLIGREIILWLLLPLAVFVGARLTSIFISALLPYGELGRTSKLLWTRNFRSLWGSFQAITTYGIVFFLATACFPFLIYTLVTQSTVGVKTGLGGTLLSLLSSRLLAKRLVEVPDEKKKIPPEFTRFALGVAVGLFLLFIVLQFCTLIALYDLSPWRHFAWTLLLFLFVGLVVDFNKLALHYFYRDRLVETYLRSEVDNGKGQMELLFDAMEMPLMHLHGTRADLTKPEKERTPAEQLWGCTAPYHLLNTAINLAGSRDLTRKDRQSGYFLFSKFYCGSAQTDYRPTAQYRKGESKLALAATISGAAAASAMGYNTFFAQAFTMTLFNLRLGYWLENPRLAKSVERQEGGVFWPWYLVREMFTKTASPRGRLVNLSDGGHTGDNVGICPLLERRCKVIIACDAECDPGLTFGSFTKALRQAYIDWGIEVDIDLSMIRRDAQTGYSRSHCAIGRIYYPDRPTQRSWLIYLKNSLTGDEPDPVENYIAEHPIFPHETTVDQFFDDDQFESYRALGVHIAQHTFANWATGKAFTDVQVRHSPFQQGTATSKEDEVWSHLLSLHSPFRASDSPEFQRMTDQFIEMEQLFLADKELGDYYAECYLQQAPKASGAENRYEIDRKIAHVSMVQIQLMEKVFFALRLDLYANAPDNHGWMNLFRRWGNAQTFQRQFDQWRAMFSEDFVAFYHSSIKNCQSIEDMPVPHPWDFLNRRGAFLDPGRK